MAGWVFRCMRPSDEHLCSRVRCINHKMPLTVAQTKCVRVDDGPELRFYDEYLNTHWFFFNPRGLCQVSLAAELMRAGLTMLGGSSERRDVNPIPPGYLTLHRSLRL